jgi:hypothetical protein
MSAKTGSAHSRYAGLLPIEPPDDFLCPIDLKPEPIDLKPEPVDLRPEDVLSPNWQPRARTRSRAPARFLIAFCTGVATTLLWQSYGDAAREMIANLYPQLGWLAPRPALTAQNPHTPDVIAPAASSAEQLNVMRSDLDVLGQSVDKSATTIAADPEPTTRGTDQIGVDQEPTTRSTDQTAATKTSSTPVETRADGASLQPTERFDIKPTEARSSRTLSERGKQLSAASRHDASCFPSASAVLQNHPGGWATWTLRAPGHEGTLCWYAAARPRVGDHRPGISHYRGETMRSEEIVGTADTELFAPFASSRRAGSWVGGLP